MVSAYFVQETYGNNVGLALMDMLGVEKRKPIGLQLGYKAQNRLQWYLKYGSMRPVNIGGGGGGSVPTAGENVRTQILAKVVRTGTMEMKLLTFLSKFILLESEGTVETRGRTSFSPSRPHQTGSGNKYRSESPGPDARPHPHNFQQCGLESLTRSG